jgi:23S rRNA (adenine-N6)-dimethyltransferase
MAHDQRKRISYSQNFLIRSNLAQRVIERAALSPDDLIIEIGPGRGALTRTLAAGCRQVIAIEKDPTLARRLGREVPSLGNVAIFEGDFLDLPLPVTPYKVVANIPFNITAAIVTKLTRAANPPEDASLVIQREAAERFMGRPKQTLAALLIQPWFDLSIAYRFRQHDFVPPPRVDVVLLRFSKRGPPLIRDGDAQEYRDFVTFGFTAWKPTIGAALGSLIQPATMARLFKESGLNRAARPSEVPFEQWLTLYRAFSCQATAEQRRAIAGAEARLRDQQAGLAKRHRTRRG